MFAVPVKLMCDILLLGIVFCISDSEVMSKKIYISLDGQNRELCGSSTSPCATIKYALSNRRRRRGDRIMVDARKGKTRDSFEEFGIRLEHTIVTIEGFNGKPVIKCKNSSAAFVLKYSKATFKTLEFKFHLSDFTSERRPKSYLKTTIAISAFQSSIDIINCHFRYVPIALKSFCSDNCKYNITDSIFESPYTAVQVYGTGECDLIAGCLVRNEFIGRRNFSRRALGFFHSRKRKKTQPSCTRLWNIFIDWCIFTYFGEAIHAKMRNNLHLQLYNSEFRHNYLLFGDQHQSSALELHDLNNNKLSHIVVIVNCIFLNNTSRAGGAIQFDTTTENSTLRIMNCTFLLNTAMHTGGAISAKGVFQVTLTDSIFSDNFCGVAPFQKHFSSPGDRFNYVQGLGGTVYLTGLDNSRMKKGSVEIDKCIFKNNSAEVSGDSLYIKKELTLSNVYIESAKHRRHGFALHTVITSTANSLLRNTTISILTTSNNQNEANFGLGLVSIDENSKFVCSKGGILHHQDLLLSQDVKVVPINYPIKLRKFSFSCETCPPDYYSLDASVLQNRTLTGTKCMRCSPGGRCRSGMIKANDNFWGFKGINTNHITFIQLPRGYGCTGGGCINYNVCAPQRKGTLCGTCENGYSESVISSKCILNRKCQIVKFWIIAVTSLCLFLIFIIYKQEVTQFVKSQFRMIKKKQQHQQQQEAHDDRDAILITEDVYISSDEYLHNDSQLEDHNNMIVEREEHDSDSVTGFIKILSYFYQIEILLRAYSNGVGSHIFQGLRHSVSSFFNLEFSVGQDASLTCALFDITPIRKIALRIVLIAMVFMILLAIFIFVTIYQGMKYKFRQRSDPDLNTFVVNKGKRFSDRLLLAIFEITLLSYAVITKSVFTLLTCVKVGSKQVLFIQGTVQCYGPWQYFLMGVGLCWVIPFCMFVFLLPGLLRERRISKKGVFVGILFPILYLFLVALQRCTMKEDEGQQDPGPLMDRILKLISGPFQSKHKHQSRWEGVYLIRRLILVSVNSFVQDQIYKLYSLLLIQVLFLLHHVYRKPFKNKVLNMVETISLTALIMLNCAKTFAVYHDKHGLHEEGADLLLLKIFAWTELSLVLFAPVVIGLIVGVLIIARISIAIFRLFKHLYHCVV